MKPFRAIDNDKRPTIRYGRQPDNVIPKRQSAGPNKPAEYKKNDIYILITKKYCQLS